MRISEFADKLGRYGSMKMDRARKRMILLRKPWVMATQPTRWLERRRPNAADALDDHLSRIHDSLAGTGFARADDIVDGETVRTLQTMVDTRIDGVRNAHSDQLSGRKDFWQAILTRDDLRENGPLVAHALTPRVVDIVTAYLGEVPFLSRLELVVSRPTDGSWKVSQLWHRDYNDRRMVKLFTYLSDVETDAQGPFTFLPSNALDRNGPMFPVHKTDGQISGFGRLDEQQKVLGKRGTSFLIDTHRCFHCGSRILDGSFRVAYIATYTTGRPYYAYDNEIELSDDAPPERALLLRP